METRTAIPGNDILISVFAQTDVGMKRPGNEDAFVVADLTSGNVGIGPAVSTHHVGDNGSLMVVSDGMGGAAAGEVASEMAVTTLPELLLGFPVDVHACEQLNKAVEMANARIWNYAQQDMSLSGMGATLTAVVVRSKCAYIAQVGDSRAYLVRGNQIKQLTKDQSLAQLLLDSGSLDLEQIKSFPQKNVITQAMGTSPTVEAAMTMVELCRDDRLILCSDGLSNKVEPEEIRDIVQQEDGPVSASRRLTQLANERGGEDNITVIVARFDGEDLLSPDDHNSITGTFQVLGHGCFS
jgi:serine/threonine protein phosphatase PrpC